MPRRRSRGAKALQGFGEGLADVSSTLLRSSLSRRQNEAILDRQAKGDARRFLQSMIEKVATGEITPEQAAVVTGQDPSTFTTMQPNLSRRLSKTAEAIDQADSPEAVPGLEQIFGAAEAAGAPNVGGLLDIARRGGVDLSMFAGEAPLPVQTLAQSAGVRRRALMDKPTERIDRTLPNGATETRFKSPYALRDGLTTGLTFEEQGRGQGVQESAKLETAPSPTILGTRAGQESRAKAEADFSPTEQGVRSAEQKAAELDRLAPIQARIANYMEAMTRDAKATTAGAMAGATKRAGLAPDIIAGEVGREGQLAEARAKATPKEPTAQERMAAANMVPLLQAHDIALSFEDRIGANGEYAFNPPKPFAVSATNSAIFNRFVPKDQQQYIQAAKNYTNTLGKITSGVTVRPDERDNFLTVMFAIDGDSPEAIAQKQASREMFNAAVQISSGRSQADAGKALAQAINSGAISPMILTTLQMEPDFESALVGALDPNVVPTYTPPGKQ